VSRTLFLTVLLLTDDRPNPWRSRSHGASSARRRRSRFATLARLRPLVVVPLTIALAACGANERSDTAGFRCGNGRLEIGELCDGQVLGEETCATLGGTAGTLSCASDCTYDLSGCDDVCGNGRIEAIASSTFACEQCDGSDLGGRRCEDFGGQGELACDDTCGFDLTSCSGTCGNGLIDPGEDCEPAIDPGVTCETLGYEGGQAVGCGQESCRFDVGGCRGELVCGNGRREGPEDCDVEDFGGFECASLGLDGGDLRCTSLCSIDDSGCTPPRCGNDRAEPGEDCDGSDLGRVSCRNLGYRDGRLGCRVDCSFDETGCSAPSCGNDVREADEECDGPDFGFFESCRDHGFSGGTLGCDASCRIVFRQCDPPPVCPNGVLEPGEDCEPSLSLDAECSDIGPFAGGSLGCSALCEFETSACMPAPKGCGNGRLDPGEDCDGRELGGRTCADLGLKPGFRSPRCGTGCSLDPASCGPPLSCGNGRLDDSEACEGIEFGGDSCLARGFASGDLFCFGCTSATDFNCIPLGCGDGRLDPGEECDPAGPLPNTCEAYGFQGLGRPSGVTVIGLDRTPCDERCRLSTFGCGSRLTCGNGVLDPGEICDGRDFGGDSCEARGRAGGTLSCFGCDFISTSSCGPLITCGDGEIQSGEDCDGSNLGGEDCSSVSGDMGVLSCTPECEFDRSGCFASCEPPAIQSELRP
jgi:hypothetical protein